MSSLSRSSRKSSRWCGWCTDSWVCIRHRAGRPCTAALLNVHFHMPRVCRWTVARRCPPAGVQACASTQVVGPWCYGQYSLGSRHPRGNAKSVQVPSGAWAFGRAMKTTSSNCRVAPGVAEKRDDGNLCTVFTKKYCADVVPGVITLHFGSRA